MKVEVIRLVAEVAAIEKLAGDSNMADKKYDAQLDAEDARLLTAQKEIATAEADLKDLSVDATAVLDKLQTAKGKLDTSKVVIRQKAKKEFQRKVKEANDQVKFLKRAVASEPESIVYVLLQKAQSDHKDVLLANAKDLTKENDTKLIKVNKDLANVARIVKAKADIVKAEAEVSRLLEASDATDEDLTNAKAEVETLKKEANLDPEDVAILDKVTERLAVLAKRKENRDEAERKLADANGKIAEGEAAAADASRREAEATAKIAEHETKAANLEEVHTAQQAKITELEEKAQLSETQKAELERLKVADARTVQEKDVIIANLKEEHKKDLAAKLAAATKKAEEDATKKAKEEAEAAAKKKADESYFTMDYAKEHKMQAAAAAVGATAVLSSPFWLSALFGLQEKESISKTIMNNKVVAIIGSVLVIPALCFGGYKAYKKFFTPKSEETDSDSEPNEDESTTRSAQVEAGDKEKKGSSKVEDDDNTMIIGGVVFFVLLVIVAFFVLSGDEEESEYPKGPLPIGEDRV